MLQNIKEVLCNNEEKIYTHTEQWIANMIKGNKNQCCLYLKGPQGVGKTTPIEFIRFHVLGTKICVETGSGPLKTKFNSELEGKILVQFEKLENFSASEWMSISSVLKRIITSPSIMIEGKGKDAVEQKNINNYVLLSNNDAIQDDDGRRYFILPVSTKYVGDTAYFENLREQCFNDEVGHAFYCYMMEVNTNNFNSQNYPMTSCKLDSFAKRLDSVYRFLKDHYILRNAGITRIKIADIYDEYIQYCNKESIKYKNKIDFNTTMKNIGIQYYSSSGEKVYKVTFETLNAISDKFHWVHELDEKSKSKYSNEVDENYEYGINKTDQSLKPQQELLKQIAELTQKLASYEKNDNTKMSNNATFNMYFGPTSKVEEEVDEKPKKVKKSKPEKNEVDLVLTELLGR